MTFDRDGRQVLNGQRVWFHRRLRLGEPANERRTPSRDWCEGWGQTWV